MKVLKVSHLAATSVNMLSEGRNLFWSRRRRREVHTLSVSSPDSNYSPGLGQILGNKRLPSKVLDPG